ncbi:hypothetical protein BC739_005582 [Kutzneria viridogrisea]|uniref:Uncharacterized protein n=1 Tax=Kutzneria viridogrisea TaxID=47990 RepID=A0ABR6BNS1_9PSEU|nr:hypothetical protein [Kutzneria viridogrisea]
MTNWLPQNVFALFVFVTAVPLSRVLAQHGQRRVR